ncbi:hypothetical protein M0R45_008605 [Rubus argutus]|uniref:START domain-containing protein n=1 Tax=Rubus argutus TaxID=59490 RepID=A0AAW1Y1P6_RUBAR
MARQVNSLDELLQSGPSESQIFEGLDELIPSSVIYSLVASTPIVPEPQPELHNSKYHSRSIQHRSAERRTSSFSWPLRVILCGSHLTATPFIQKLSTLESTYECLNEVFLHPSSNLKPRGHCNHRAIIIVQTLMEVDQWCTSSVAWSPTPRSGGPIPREEEESYKERKQVISAEFVLATPYVPAREAQFVRYSHQQLDGSWIVDVSVDELRQFHRPSTRSVCRKRPSGCLIRDMQNGSSLVTWVENVDVRKKKMSACYTQALC